MAIEEINVANPPPAESNLPAEALNFAVVAQSVHLDEDTLEGLRSYRKAADYIAAAMIFLQDNVLLEDELKPENVKSRLLGTSRDQRISADTYLRRRPLGNLPGHQSRLRTLEPVNKNP